MHTEGYDRLRETGARTRQVIDNDITYSMPDFQRFHVRDLMGPEGASNVLYDDPGLACGIVEWQDWIRRTDLFPLVELLWPEIVQTGQDIRYRSGMLVSPGHFRELFACVSRSSSSWVAREGDPQRGERGGHPARAPGQGPRGCCTSLPGTRKGSSRGWSRPEPGDR